MRQTRTALARLFVNIAALVLPEGMGGIYLDLLHVNEELSEERRRQKERAA